MKYSFGDLYEALEIGESDLVHKIISEESSLMYGEDEYGFRVVHALASNDNEELARFILEMGIDVNSKNDEGITALHIALYPEIAQLLINHGADVNITDNRGNTPLHIHASDGEETFEVIKVLLSNGADKSIENKSGKRAYDIAKSREDKDNMKILK